MRLAIIGSRDFNDLELVKQYVDRISESKNIFGEPEFVIVSGGAKGVDLCAEWRAKQKGLTIVRFNPDWARHGKGAGFVRNIEIVEHTDKLTAFWNGYSRGTKHCIEAARVRNIACNVYYEAQLNRKPEIEWNDN